MSALDNLDQTILSKVSLSVDRQIERRGGPQPGDLFPTATIVEMIEQIESLVDCEAIQTMIENRLNALFDSIKSKIELSADMSILAVIMSLPSSFEDIIKWAKKFVATYIAPQIRALVNIIAQLVEFVQALIDLANAIQTAIENVIACAIAGVKDAIDGVLAPINEKIAEVTSEIDSALGVVDDFQNKLTGITGGEAPLDTSSASNLLTSVENGAFDVLDAQTKLFNEENSFETGDPDPDQLVLFGEITTSTAPLSRVINRVGSGYSPGDKIVIVSSTGSGANVEIGTTLVSNTINRVIINNGGSGYSYSDSGYINGANGVNGSIRLGLDNNYYSDGFITIYGNQAEWLSSL
jgi:hypothetical protein